MMMRRIYWTSLTWTETQYSTHYDVFLIKLLQQHLFQGYNNVNYIYVFSLVNVCMICPFAYKFVILTFFPRNRNKIPLQIQISLAI